MKHPIIKAFNLPSIPFQLIDPTELPLNYKVKFEAFLRGSATPHPLYAYIQDYDRFLLLIDKGHINVDEIEEIKTQAGEDE